MKRIFTFLLLSFAISAVNAQGTTPAIQWAKTLGHPHNDGNGSWDILPLEDGGFVVAGTLFEGNAETWEGESDYWVFKLDAAGAIVWQHSYGGSDDELSKRISKAPGGGYFIAGETYSHDGDVGGNHNNSGYYTDWWILKIDEAGTIIWEKNLGGASNEVIYDGFATPDGGYIALGTTTSSDGDVVGAHNATGYTSDGWVVKLDTAGNIEWSKCYGGFGGTALIGIDITPDGGYVMVGETEALGGDVPLRPHLVMAKLDAWVIKTDATGNIEWSQLYGGSEMDGFSSVELTESGGYIMTGFTDSADGDVSFSHTTPGGWAKRDVWVVEVDASGGLLWEKTYGGIGNEIAYRIRATGDCGYALAGHYLNQDFEGHPSIVGENGISGGNDGFLMKIDLEGEVVWVKTMGGTQQDLIWNFALTPDGGYVTAGTTNSVDGNAVGNNTFYGWIDPWEGWPEYEGQFLEWFGTYDNWIVKLGPDCEVPQFTTDAQVDVCSGGDVTLVVTTTGQKISWYDSADATVPVHTGASLALTNVTANASYWVEVANCRCISPRTKVDILVNPIPVVTAQDAATCEGTPAVITASSAGNTINWYTTETDTNILFTGAEYTTPSLSANTTYWVEATSPDGCVSERVAVSVTVNALPVLSTVASVAVCNGDTAALSTSSAGNTINWYNGATDTTILFTGTQFTTPSLSANTSYWVEAVSPEGCVSARAEVAVTVNAVPVLTVSNPAAICGGNTAAITASSTGNTINWYSSATDTTILFTGIQFTTPQLSSNASYWAEAVSPEGCASQRTEVSVTVNAVPVLTVQNTSVCEGTAATVTASSAGNSINWYASQSDAAILYTGTEYTTPVLTASTSYWVEAVSAEGCGSGRTQVTVTVNPLPALSMGTVNLSVCSGSGAVLSATPSAGNVIVWFANENDTQPIATGADYSTVMLTETTSYWAAAYNPQTHCLSGKTQFTVTVNANATPVVEFGYGEETYCFAADNPMPVLAAGFTAGGEFSATSGLALNAETGEIDIRTSQPGNYTVAYEVSDEDTCLLYGRYEIQVIIEACADIQRGISPNSDEYNQYFDLTGMGVKELAIFNRYGQEVYGASNYVKEWEGQDKSGQELPTGTYFYAINKNDGKQITGWVYINRN
ncbi:gliding motility-associated C-terminal domain-containing protein [uncultured Flavobacterium sp.]|uniref:Ig-like domain-containing protein n=1 Tax=uncultured Flavobacterium sp. TaxID=165435 RepID=UPI0025F6FA14|nr:gliding motility-associated C-terminal domain-containing protein [uncultured Flavobacterium sp.]